MAECSLDTIVKDLAGCLPSGRHTARYYSEEGVLSYRVTGWSDSQLSDAREKLKNKKIEYQEYNFMPKYLFNRKPNEFLEPGKDMSIVIWDIKDEREGLEYHMEIQILKRVQGDEEVASIIKEISKATNIEFERKNGLYVSKCIVPN